MNRILITTLLATVCFSAAFATPLQDGLKAIDAKDYPKASKLLAEAFEKGEPDAAFYMGRLLEVGIDGKADPQAAVAMYAAGAAKNSAMAKNRLGVLHMEGTGVLQDYEQGKKLICEAAEAGDANAQFNCGALYDQGKGVTKDTKKAMDWYKKSAEKGNIAAKNSLGIIYADGAEKDTTKAFQVWQQTAAVGNPFGLFRLGDAYGRGVGTPKDLVKAHAYLNLASARGVNEAQAIRAELEKQLTPEQITQAQQIARSWKPVEDKGKK